MEWECLNTLEGYQVPLHFPNPWPQTSGARSNGNKETEARSHLEARHCLVFAYSQILTSATQSRPQGHPEFLDILRTSWEESVRSHGSSLEFPLPWANYLGHSCKSDRR